MTSTPLLVLYAVIVIAAIPAVAAWARHEIRLYARARRMRHPQSRKVV